jgi:hypothetical protein
MNIVQVDPPGNRGSSGKPKGMDLWVSGLYKNGLISTDNLKQEDE